MLIVCASAVTNAISCAVVSDERGETGVHLRPAHRAIRAGAADDVRIDDAQRDAGREDLQHLLINVHRVDPILHQPPKILQVGAGGGQTNPSVAAAATI